MSTGKKGAKVENMENGNSANPARPKATASKRQLRAAIERLWMEMHLSKHPLDKVRLYEEIKMLENELSGPGDGD
jgi:hypothetical protein